MTKVHRTFANWRESTVLSPIYLRTFAIGECPVGESHIGEIREPPLAHFWTCSAKKNETFFEQERRSLPADRPSTPPITANLNVMYVKT